LAVENTPGITIKLHIGNARQAAYMAMLADYNCHPSSWNEFYKQQVRFIIWSNAARGQVKCVRSM